MSFASQTWTMDTASTPWVYPDGEATTMADTSQTATWTGTDTGDGGRYIPRGAVISISLANGDKLKLDVDKRFSRLWSEADGATYNNGSIWASINGGKWEEVKVVTMNVTDGDAVGTNGLASITFEYPGKPYRWSWTNVNTA